MATREQAAMQQLLQDQAETRHTLKDHYCSTRQMPHALQHKEKRVVVVQSSLITQKNTQTRYYIPKALRTGILVAFCITVSIVFAILQAVSVAYVKEHGFDASPTASANSRRDTRPQSSSPSCPPGATCAPARGSWTSPSPTPPPAFAPNPGSFTSPSAIYFFGAYAPTLLAILLSVWWKCVFKRAKEIEPFYQLANKDGARPEDSLFLSYSSDVLPVVLTRSLRAKHWLTFIGAGNTVLLVVVTLLAAESIHLVGVGDGCGVVVDAKDSSNEDCEMQLLVRPALGFILGGILIAVLFSAAILVARLRRQPSGLRSEATSIAGIAALSTQALADTPQQFLRIPGRRFALAQSDVDGKPFIAEMTPAVQEPMLQPYQVHHTSPTGPRRESHREMRPIFLTIFLLCQAAILSLIVYYGFISKPGTNDPIEDFMNSESFGIRLFMTCLGLGTKFYWGWIEKYVQIMSPYVALAAPEGAPANKSVLIMTTSHPVTALFRSSTWKHGLLGPVTLMTVLSEILVVTLNTVPFTDTTAYTAFQVSVYFCLAILGLMILTLPGVIVWIIRLKDKYNVVDAPECIADVICMAGDSDLWRGLAGMNEKERMEAVGNWHIRFATRQVHGRWQIITLK